MQEKIFHSEMAGAPALCFDTGLNGQDFARAGFSKLLAGQGFLVKIDGTVENWKCAGVIEKMEKGEQNGTMIIWGADVPGAPLSALVVEDDFSKKDRALDAIRRWINARIILSHLSEEKGKKRENTFLAPGGTFIDDKGNVFFPPKPLVERCLEAEDALEGRDRFVHPDFDAPDADIWTLACMLYRLFCGENAFQEQNIETLRQDMRESVYFPPRFICFNLDKTLDSLINRSFSRFYEDHPSLEEWKKFLGDADSKERKNFDAYFHTISQAEVEKILREKEKFAKNKQFSTQTKRFLTKNNALILGGAIIVMVVGLIVGSVIYDRSNLPNTKGLPPVEVVNAYYKAFNELDHVFMKEIVLKKAGKDDIDMASELFVLGKVRQAYQMGAPSDIITAQDWLNSIQPTLLSSEALEKWAESGKIVFGVTDLHVQTEDTDESDGEVSFFAAYKLWAPVFGARETPDGGFIPAYAPRSDFVRLVFHKGAWRIAEIARK
jgi:hypothetical protein